MKRVGKFKSKLINTLFSFPVGFKRRLAGSVVQVDGSSLDLDMQLMLKLSSLEPSPELGKQSTQMDRSRRSMRESAQFVAGTPVEMNTRELTLGQGGYSIPARLYQPEKGINALLLFFHGGGWAQGDLDSHDALCRHLARVSGAHVLSVDYRRAPENPWPAAVDDAVAAYVDATTRLAEFGVTRPAIALAGDSAGANIATVLARKISHLEMQQPLAQLLIYPATDASCEHPSKHLFAEGFLLTLDNIRIYEKFYIPSDDARKHPDISPLLANDIDRLAPAIVVTAGFDPLRDEGERYAEHLAQAGVRVIPLVYPALIHGFANMLCTASALRAVEEMTTELRRLLVTDQ